MVCYIPERELRQYCRCICVSAIYLAFAFQKASPSDAAAAVTDASASGVKRRADDDSTAAKLARTV